MNESQERWERPGPQNDHHQRKTKSAQKCAASRIIKQ